MVNIDMLTTDLIQELKFTDEERLELERAKKCLSRLIKIVPKPPPKKP